MGIPLSRPVSFLINQFRPLPYPDADLSGQTIIVTGANVGLGLEAARHFVRLKAAHVIIACRNQQKGEAARQDIETSTGRMGVVEVWPLDLTSFESVKRFARRADALPRLDALVENAGVACQRFERAEKWESTITVNVISTAYLALLLLPKLKKTASQYDVRPRLTIVSSDAHRMARFKERSRPNLFDYYQSDRDVGDRYAASKLIEIFFVRELASQLEASGDNAIVINALCPGFCRSDIFRNLSLPVRVLASMAVFLLARTTEMGSRTLVAAAVAGKETHGHFMDNCEVAKPGSYVLSEEGLRMQKRVFAELTDVLETVEPGLVKNATE